MDDTYHINWSTNRLKAATSEKVLWIWSLPDGSDQPPHSRSLIRIFIDRILKNQSSKISSCGQRRLWSDCADALADLSLCWAHMSVGTCTFSHIETYHIRPNYRTYSYKRTVKQFHSLQIIASVLFVYFFIKAYVVGTHLNCRCNSNEYPQHMF